MRYCLYMSEHCHRRHVPQNDYGRIHTRLYELVWSVLNPHLQLKIRLLDIVMP